MRVPILVLMSSILCPRGGALVALVEYSFTTQFHAYSIVGFLISTLALPLLRQL